MLNQILGKILYNLWTIMRNEITNNEQKQIRLLLFKGNWVIQIVTDIINLLILTSGITHNHDQLEITYLHKLKKSLTDKWILSIEVTGINLQESLILKRIWWSKTNARDCWYHYLRHESRYQHFRDGLVN